MGEAPEPSGAPPGAAPVGFWPKLRRAADRIGREAVEKLLMLVYAAQSPQTPRWAKTVIAGALAYFVLPTDAVPDILPGIGFTDDLSMLAAALAAVALYIDPAIRARAERTAAGWFGPKPTQRAD